MYKCFCFFCFQVAEPLLPYALAFAAGAMVYVVVDDIVPEAHHWYVSLHVTVYSCTPVVCKPTWHCVFMYTSGTKPTCPCV